MEITTKENQKVAPSSASRGALNSGKILNAHVEFAQRKRENWDARQPCKANLIVFFFTILIFFLSILISPYNYYLLAFNKIY